MKTSYIFLPLLIGSLFISSSDSIAQDGEAIFKQNCSACHMLGRRLVGPDLVGVSERRNEEWLINFIKSSQSMINEGDPDAVAIFEEYNKTLMTDQTHLSDGDIKAILDYINPSTSPDESFAVESTKAPIEVERVEYSSEDIEAGMHLFSGKKAFINGGPSCLSCHNVNNKDLFVGGMLAKDLTNVYSRMGDAGVAGIVGAPPFPAMTVAYENSELDSSEIVQLTAFLQFADEVSADQEVKSATAIFVVGGGGGLIVLLMLIGFIWKARLKAGVKHDIFRRQIKGSDSLI